MLIDKNLMKKDLIEMAGITTNAMAKMGKGGDVSTQVLSKICNVLDCKLEDIVELDSEQESCLHTSSLIQSVCVVSAPEKMSQMLLRACWGFQLWIVPSNTSEPKATKKQS